MDPYTWKRKEIRSHCAVPNLKENFDVFPQFFLRESDDVNKIIQQLLEDKKLPLEWHERVAFALQMAKDNLQRKKFKPFSPVQCFYF